MFSLMKPKKNIYAISDGKAVPLCTLNDGVFSKGTIGDGIAIQMTGDKVCSPSNGLLKMVFPTLHAFGIQCDNGMELLIHIGIDTVNLRGNGFTLLSQKGKKVKIGQPIIKIDRDFLIDKGYECNAILIILNSNNLNYQLKYSESAIAGKTTVIQLEG